MDSDRDVLGGGRAFEAGGSDPSLLEAALGALRNPLAYLLPVLGPSGRAVDFRLSWANPPYVARFAPHDDAIGRLLSQVTPLEWRDSLVAAYIDAFEHQQQRALERTLEIDGHAYDYLFNLLPTGAGLAVSVDDRTKRKRAESELALTTSLLRGITRLQERFLAGEPLAAVLDEVVTLALEVTGSARGFVGEVREGDSPHVHVLAMHDDEWSDEQREHGRKTIEESAACFEALWRAVLRDEDTVFGDEHSTESAKYADGFVMCSYLGVPIRRHNKLVGVIGVANRPRGYDDDWALRLDPLVAAAGALLEAAHQAAERELIEAELRRSEELLREAQELAALGAYSYTLPDGPTHWTRQMFSLFGVPSESPPLPLADCFKLASEDYRQALQEIHASVMRDGEQREIDVLFRVNGLERHMQVVVRGRFDQRARVVELHGTVKDITERKQVESSRIRFEQQIAETQRLEALGLLAGGIAHDVNNLLVGVLANAQVMHEELPEGEHREAAFEIEMAARRMAELMRQILDYAGRSRASLQALDLNPLTTETIQLVRRTLAKSAKLTVTLVPQRLTVEVDAAQLRQVVMNLVINAGEALSGSPGEVVVTTSTDRGPDGRPRAVLEVRDTGVGMSEDVRRRIFDPFYTTKAKGRGLGLSAVHGIVRRFGGVIEVDSVPLRGTTFRVALPLSSRHVTPVQGMRATATRTRRLSVLVVDDEAMVRSAVQRILERQNCDVVLADGGREALHYFATMKDRFDMVLLDVLMPYLSGADVLREIRRIAPRQRVVMMSGFVGQDEQATTIADGFLKKPFTGAEIEGLLAVVDAKREKDS